MGISVDTVKKQQEEAHRLLNRIREYMMLDYSLQATLANDVNRVDRLLNLDPTQMRDERELRNYFGVLKNAIRKLIVAHKKANRP